MKYIAILTALLLTGCATTVPVTAKFPEPPGTLVSEPCPQLQRLNDDAKLSDVAKTVTLNYTTYYECSIKLDAWIKWYSIQKTIYEGIK